MTRPAGTRSSVQILVKGLAFPPGKPVEQMRVFGSRLEEPCIVTALHEPVALPVDGSGRLLVAYGGFRELVVIDRCRWDGLAR